MIGLEHCCFNENVGEFLFYCLICSSCFFIYLSEIDMTMKHTNGLQHFGSKADGKICRVYLCYFR